MNIKLSQVVLAYKALSAISNNTFDALTAYRINKNMRALEPDYTAYEKQRMALVKKYGDKTVDENKQEGWNVPQGTKKWEAFQKELAPLIEEDIEVNVIKIPLMAFDKISPAISGAIEFMLDLPAEEVPVPGVGKKRLRK